SEYVNRLGQNIARNSDASMPMTFKVVESNDVDCRAFPGGFVYISSGTILAADNEAELASVLAQQIGHIAARHFTEDVSKAELVNLPAIAQFSRFLRQQVIEGDYLGLQYLYKTGYEPKAANTFLQKLQALNPPNRSGTSTMFSPEPPLADRIA